MKTYGWAHIPMRRPVLRKGESPEEWLARVVLLVCGADARYTHAYRMDAMGWATMLRHGYGDDYFAFVTEPPIRESAGRRDMWVLLWLAERAMQKREAAA